MYFRQTHKKGLLHHEATPSTFFAVYPPKNERSTCAKHYGWLVGWFIDWLTGWLIVGLIGWLMDGRTDKWMDHPLKKMPHLPNQSGKIGRRRSFWDGKISAAFCVGKMIWACFNLRSHLFRGETAKNFTTRFLNHTALVEVADKNDTMISHLCWTSRRKRRFLVELRMLPSSEHRIIQKTRAYL